MNPTPEELYLESIVKPLLQYPQDYVCYRTVDDKGILLRVNVNRDDLGKIIGKQGANAKAIRTIIRVYGGITKQNIYFKVSEPQG